MSLISIKVDLKKIILPCLFLMSMIGQTAMGSNDEGILPEPNEVLISANSIGIPVGRFLLIRKENDYCAVRFTQNFTGKTEYDMHAEYESYYQGDKTGNFDSKSVCYRKEFVYYTKPSFSIFGHPIRIGAKRDIICGPMELWWSAGPNLTFVYYNRHDQNQGDYGFELAPTPWTDIKEVNVYDKRIRWSRFVAKSKRLLIPIDKLWDNSEKK
jgi:hypothetical protein